jgi:hypothetical protein
VLVQCSSAAVASATGIPSFELHRPSAISIVEGQPAILRIGASTCTAVQMTTVCILRIVTSRENSEGMASQQINRLPKNPDE